MDDKKFNLEERLIDFAVVIVSLFESMPKTKSASHLGGQLLRSGTSPASILHQKKNEHAEVFYF